MTLAQHERAATTHEKEAQSHQAAYRPDAEPRPSECYSDAVCWASNPTAEHRADAEKHRKMAADHRAASAELRAAEMRSCTGVAVADRDASPFGRRDDITEVTAATMKTPDWGNTQPSTLVGATITFRAVPGLTAEWLQRIVDCHLARNNSVANDMPEMSDCPLAPKGVTATVRSAGAGFAVTVESNDPATAKEVLRRAQALKSRS